MTITCKHCMVIDSPPLNSGARKAFEALVTTPLYLGFTATNSSAAPADQENATSY